MTTKLIQFFLICSLIILSFSTAKIFADQLTIEIPLGDHEKGLRTVIEWYTPINHDIDAGDTVTWVNKDMVSHTVTSGKGIGPIGTVGNEQNGKPDGYFDSGIIEPGKSWLFTFQDRGVFTYFCTIHPWIERSITVLEPGIDVSNFRISYTLLSNIIIITAVIVGIIALKKVRNKKTIK